jgi:hypothetical protein
MELIHMAVEMILVFEKMDAPHKNYYVTQLDTIA